MEKEVYLMMKNEQSIHWWFVGKRNIVCTLFEKYGWNGRNKKAKILDVGCGMGEMLEALSKYGDVYGCDVSPIAVEYCKEKWRDKIQLGKLPEDKIYEEEQFDCVLALDVLEHIEHDEDMLGYLYKILKNDACFICTVPAEMRQWTYNDELVHHYRRYEYKELQNKVEKAGLKIEKISFYNSIMYPAVILVRKVKKIFGIKTADIGMNTRDSCFNKVLKKIFSSEGRFLLEHNFKHGVSLILVARKEKVTKDE